MYYHDNSPCSWYNDISCHRYARNSRKPIEQKWESKARKQNLFCLSFFSSETRDYFFSIFAGEGEQQGVSNVLSIEVLNTPLSSTREVSNKYTLYLHIRQVLTPRKYEYGYFVSKITGEIHLMSLNRPLKHLVAFYVTRFKFQIKQCHDSRS